MVSIALVVCGEDVQSVSSTQEVYGVCNLYSQS